MESSSSSSAPANDNNNVWLFYPNLIGYGRIVLAIMAMYCMSSSPCCAMLCYALSAGLDAFDGWAARTYNQSSRFGAMLDQLTDRCDLLALVMALCKLFPDHLFLLQQPNIPSKHKMSATEDPWKALLHISTKASEAKGEQKATKDDGKQQPEIKGKQEPEINAENMEFLKNAIAGMNGGGDAPKKDPFQTFFDLGALDKAVLYESSSHIAIAKELAEMLMEYLSYGNFAEQFITAHGLTALRNLTLSINEEISLLYLRLVPMLAENRQEFQEAVVKSGLLETYVDMLGRCKTDKKTPKLSPIILQAVISAVSSIVRGCQMGWEEFHKLKGMDKLVEIVKTCEDDKSAARAAHLLWAINFTFTDPTDQEKETEGYHTEYLDEEWDSDEEFSDEEALWREYLRVGRKQKKLEPLPKRNEQRPVHVRQPKNRSESVTRFVELRNHLVIVYASLLRRISSAEELRKEWLKEEIEEETEDWRVFNFLRETCEEIR